MKIAVFNSKPYVQKFFNHVNKRYNFTLEYIEEHLCPDTAHLAAGYDAVCVFVNDTVDARTLAILKDNGVRLVALRCAGYNNVDLEAARHIGICIVRVPAYSPFAVAEHSIALMMALNRKIYKAHSRVREGNFSLEGLMGFDMHQTPVGIIGTGKIGQIVAKILHGFGCELYAYDPNGCAELEQYGVKFVTLDELYRQSYIISLHCPLTPHTYHMIDQQAIDKMRECVMIVNTSRGALIDTKAAIDGLKSGRIGYLGLDVYEEEDGMFFEDMSDKIIHDDTFARLMMFPNVLVTGHQAFYTYNAVKAIAETTMENIRNFENGKPQNTLTCVCHRPAISNTEPQPANS